MEGVVLSVYRATPVCGRGSPVQLGRVGTVDERGSALPEGRAGTTPGTHSPCPSRAGTVGGQD